MTIISSEAPKFVKSLDRELGKLAGMTFPLKRSYTLNGFEFHESLEPSKLAEGAVYSALINVSSESNVIQEPNGYRTFPDFKVKFNNNFEYLFEVKSFTSSSRAWSAANFNEYNRALENRDLKYFKAYYVDFNFKISEDLISIKNIHVGKIYDFSPGGPLSGSNPFIPARATGVDLPTFLNNTINNLEHKEWASNILLKS